MKAFPSRYSGICNGCKDRFVAGTEIAYDDVAKKAYHLECQPVEQPDLLGASEAEQLADRLGFEK